MRHLTHALLVAAATLTLSAGPITYTAPNLDTTPVGATKSVSFGGATYLNKGLVGVGNFTASSLDTLGDTLGSFSSFKVDTTTWRRNVDGSYAGMLYTLPDRGYNVAGLIDYAARIQKFALAFTPDYTTAPVGQTQLTLTFKGTTKITDFNGNGSTAVNPTGTTLGSLTSVPVANGKLALDAEGLAIAPNGSFYVSDEYGATILNVARDGRLLGKISPVQALIPQFTEASGLTGYTSQINGVDVSKATDPTVQTGGRRDNQGMEAVDITPDGKYLVAMLQSATRQDTPGNLDNNRSYTRLFVYDVSKNATPSSPVGHYLVELPTFSSKGVGAAANKTAAQSEIVALSSTTFMVLTRDGNGNGAGNAGPKSGSTGVGYADNPLVFKSIALVSTASATNLAGTTYETGYTPAVTGTGSTLAPVANIVAATTTDFVNLLNVQQLARFGLNTNTVSTLGVASLAAIPGASGVTAQNVNSLSEKWEALSVVPCLDVAYPNDYFLLVGNDNDFITADGSMLGSAYNGVVTPTSGSGSSETVENINRVLVYRVTLPGYVDPGLVVSASNRAPLMAGKNLRSAQLMGTSFNSMMKTRLIGNLRMAAPVAFADTDGAFAEPRLDFCMTGVPSTHAVSPGLRWWFDGSIRDITDAPGGSSASLDGRSTAGALGLEWDVASGLYVGLGFGMQDGNSSSSDGSSLSFKGRSVTTYAVARGERFFGSLTMTLGRQDLDAIQSAGPYGSTPTGVTNGRSLSADLLVGANAGEFVGWSVVPTLGVSRSISKINGYTEAGVGGVTYPTQSSSTNTAAATVEFNKAFAQSSSTITPVFRGGFEHEFGGEDQSTNVSVLTNAGSVGVALTLPNADRDIVLGAVGLRWKQGDLNAELSFERRSGDNGYRESRFNLGLSASF